MVHPLSRSRFRPRAGQRFKVGEEEYALAGEIGDGAAGVVRRARRIEGGTLRAVKFLAPDPKYIEEEAFDDVAVRFRREGERGVGVQHHNLVKMFAFCENKDGCAFDGDGPQNPFLLMELVRGKTLESEIRGTHEARRRIFDVTERRLSIAIQIARAIEYLHERKIVHRDVKPANIMLDGNELQPRPRVRLGDFGVVKWGDFLASISTGVLTATRQVGLGTMKYMSPEQAVDPKEVTVRSDIYSFGITLLELFTGQILLSPHHVFAVMSARMERGNSVSRLMSIGIGIGYDDEALAATILDMHLRGVTGRPAIRHVRGVLERQFETRFDRAFKD